MDPRTRTSAAPLLTLPPETPPDVPSWRRELTLHASLAMPRTAVVTTSRFLGAPLDLCVRIYANPGRPVEIASATAPLASCCLVDRRAERVLCIDKLRIELTREEAQRVVADFEALGLQVVRS